MAYADYAFYITKYLHKPSGAIAEAEFDFFASTASAKLDYMTAGRITAELAEKEEVKTCCCAIAEVLCRQHSATDNASAAPVASWSNDGESGSYDMAHSAATDEVVDRKVSQLIRTYLWRFGLLYRGCYHAE